MGMVRANCAVARSTSWGLVLVVLCALSAAFVSCKADVTPSEKAAKARALEETQDLYEMLDGYPALASMFRNSNLSVRDFEKRFFDAFLGDALTADNLIVLLDRFPSLFLPREVADDLFPSGVRDEMSEKGPLQDAFFATTETMQNIMSLPPEDKQVIYDFLDMLSGKTVNREFMNDTVAAFLRLAANSLGYCAASVDEDGKRELIEKLIALLDHIIRINDPDSLVTNEEVFAGMRSWAYEFIAYYAAADRDRVNADIAPLLSDLSSMKARRPGELDFVDIDEFINRNVSVSGASAYLFNLADMTRYENVITVSAWLTRMSEAERVRESFRPVLMALGAFMRQDESRAALKQVLASLRDRYGNGRDGNRALADLLVRVWSEGQEVGDWVRTKNGSPYPGYGQSQNLSIAHLLTQPQLVNSMLVWINRLKGQGYRIDGVGQGFADAITHDPQVQPRDSGRTYPFPGSFEYQNFSWFRGLLKLASRFSQPLTPASSFLYEHEDGERNWINEGGFNRLVEFFVDAHKIPMASFVWSDVYERNDPDPRGLPGAHPKRTNEDNRYGVFIDEIGDDGRPNGQRRFIAPVFPELITGTEVAFYAGADCLFNGPYDNYYENGNWLFYERNFYCVIDLIQFLPLLHMDVPQPDLKRDGLVKFMVFSMMRALFGSEVNYGEFAAKAFRHFLRVESIPIVLYRFKGVNQIIYSDLGDILRNVGCNIRHGIKAFLRGGTYSFNVGDATVQLAQQRGELSERYRCDFVGDSAAKIAQLQACESRCGGIDCTDGGACPEGESDCEHARECRQCAECASMDPDLKRSLLAYAANPSCADTYCENIRQCRELGACAETGSCFPLDESNLGSGDCDGTGNIIIDFIVNIAVDIITDIIAQVTPLGNESPEDGRVYYMLPQDLRDVWTVLSSLVFFDPAAFHEERLWYGSDRNAYYKNYDVSDHNRYYYKDFWGEENPHLNKVAPLVAIFCLSFYEPYRDLLAQPQYALTNDNVKTDAGLYGTSSAKGLLQRRQEAAISNFGGAVYPIYYLINVFAALAESTPEENLYHDRAGNPRHDQQMPFARAIEPFLAQPSAGLIDSVLEVASVLGDERDPEIISIRRSLTMGVARMFSDPATSANEENVREFSSWLLRKIDTAIADDWEYLDLAFDIGGRYVSPDYRIVDHVVGMLDPRYGVTAQFGAILQHFHEKMTDPDSPMTQADVEGKLRWLVRLMELTSEKMLVSRTLVNAADIAERLGETNPWHELAYVSMKAFDPEDGALSYVLMGMEKSHIYTWDEVIGDLIDFLRSDTMTRNDEGSFWRDIYYISKFMADSL